MATNQKYRMGIIEGDIYIFATAGEVCDVHDIVMLTNSTTFVKCTSTGTAFGLSAEKVTTAGVADYEPGGLVSHTAKVGDLVGVYIDGGVYNHGMSGLVAGKLAYVSAAFPGKLTTTAPTSGSTAVALVCQDSTTAGLAKVKSFL